MPVAPTYNRQFNFTNYQAVNPATPLPATPLDSELSSVKVTLDALNTNLNLIQRSDGQLANASVGAQQLQAGLLTGISPPTQWSGSGVIYDVNDTVFFGLLLYVCNTANVSSSAHPPSSFAAWTFLADFSGVTIAPGSVTSAAFAPGAVNSAALGPNLALLSSPSPGDNSTAIATTAFVDTALANLTNITTTPTTGDNSTAIATTAFVNAEIGGVITASHNRIINGAMAIDQRNNGSSGTGQLYTVDRWKYLFGVAGKITWQQKSTSGSLPQFPFCLSATTSVAYTLTSADGFGFITTIEAFDTSDLQWGTAGAQPVTLSFWVQASLTGNYSGSLRNSAKTRSFPFSFNVAVANVWQQVFVGVPGDTTGAWISGTTGAGVLLFFNLGSGSALVGTAGAWATGNFTSDSAGAAGIVGTLAASIKFTGVSFQVGVAGAATPFEFRSYGTELALCQRYYETQTDTLAGNYTTATSYNKYSGFAVAKRQAPSMTYSGITAAGFPTTNPPATSTPALGGIIWGSTANATGAGHITLTWAADADF